MSKKEQFQHNLKKAKRQAKAEREFKDNSQTLRDLFADFGKIYNNK